MLLALAAAAVLLAGGPTVFVWAVALLAGYITLARRYERSMSLAYAVIAFFVAELALLLVVPVTGISLAYSETIAWTVVSLGAGGYAAMKPSARPSPQRGDWWLGVAASTGAVLVIATTALAQVIPGALRLAWAMNADAINVMGFARRMLADHGISQVSTPQPTPLPFAMVASNLAGGRAWLAQSAVLEHDVARLAQVWVFVIAIACLLAGAIVARLAVGIRRRLAVPIVALVSCAGLTWYIVGVQFQFGFVNSAFAIALLLAAWLAYLAGEARPLSSLAALFLAATAILAVWSPLVVVVAALGATVLFSKLAHLRRYSLRLWLVAALAALVFLAYLALVTVPQALAESVYLSADGGFPPIGPASIVVIVSVTAVLACVVGRFTSLAHEAIGSLTMMASFGIGLGYLLLQRTNASNPWGYYPAKFAWTVSILLLVIAMGFAVSLLAAHPPRSRWDGGIVVLAACLFVSMLWSPGGAQRPLAQLPLLGIVQGNAFGLSNTLADTVFALSGNGKSVVWRTVQGDFWPNYWLLQIDIAHPATNPVGPYAQHVGVFSVKEMCAVVTLFGNGAVVYTSDPAAEAELAATCSGTEYRVERGSW